MQPVHDEFCELLQMLHPIQQPNFNIFKFFTCTN